MTRNRSCLNYLFKDRVSDELWRQNRDNFLATVVHDLNVGGVCSSPDDDVIGGNKKI